VLFDVLFLLLVMGRHVIRNGKLVLNFLVMDRFWSWCDTLLESSLDIGMVWWMVLDLILGIDGRYWFLKLT
jgi:hypothetical protein